ncbi:DNA-binding domain-containing protein [Neptunomonas antarctica]|uniref:Putative DNA-binding domain-containing protein n=1 Tax=Neptunomonas antarctica TaxID=619304 RepID=A0A1N7LPT7_9GAMM|nr:DNA-binding domain-containing protein [Neptunomonas antarctica]SIS75802.1 Putative DNA-binding domain-containing protein [Neptunomonas antarctica]
MAVDDYIAAFAHYLRTGDANRMHDFCVNPEHIKRMAVYRNGFYKGCIDALSANFPMCEKLVGNESFRNAAHIYVDHYPPEKGTLVGYGQNFSGFIADFFSGLVTNESQALPVNIADLAHLDYAWLTSLMSADSEQVLRGEHVAWLVAQGHDLALVEVRLSPSVILCDVGASAFSQWLSLKTNQKEDEQGNSASTNDLVMFWRRQGAVQARSLSVPEAALMRALQRVDSTLDSGFAAALEVDPDFDVSDIFSACLQNELLETDMTQYRPESDLI